MTNNEITHAVLTSSENKSLLALKARAQKSGLTHRAVTSDQLRSMKNAFLAILASGNAVSEQALKEAKALGWI